MSALHQTLVGRWRELRRHHRTDRQTRFAFAELNDHLLRDIGLQPRCSVRVAIRRRQSGVAGHLRLP